MIGAPTCTKRMHIISHFINLLTGATLMGYFMRTCFAFSPTEAPAMLVAPRKAVVRRMLSSSTASVSSESDTQEEHAVKILERGKHHLVVSKPPGVVCHHSEWTGSRTRNEVPMLQRVRNAVQHRVNLVHRLDRGCSGCLLLALSHEDRAKKYPDDSETSSTATDATKNLIEAMKQPESQKTYLALVRGEGILKGQDLKEQGWFLVDRPIKDESGTLNNATTWFRFVAGIDNGGGTLDKPRASLVLARPETGRWHQIRRHLNGLSHPILGDSTHGNSKVNREFRQKYGLPQERTCLHLARLQLRTNNPEYSSPGLERHQNNDGTKGKHGVISVLCPLEADMWNMLQSFMPDLWDKAKPELEKEGIFIEPT